MTKIVGDLPHMTADQARRITTFIAEQDVTDVLELGFRHGVSTCWMAAALAGRDDGHGKITTIDLAGARDADPNVETLLDQLGERDRVDVFYEPHSYTWRLMKFLEESPEPRFDFCYIDGAHTWFVDALAFFLVDRLLQPGGWIVFDDLDWTHANSPALRASGRLDQIPADERDVPQVRKVYELLVRPHPNYHNFRTEDGWAFAQKRTDTGTFQGIQQLATEHVVRVERVHVGLGAALLRGARRLSGR